MKEEGREGRRGKEEIRGGNEGNKERQSRFKKMYTHKNKTNKKLFFFHIS
jgi:hypothetical protein